MFAVIIPDEVHRDRAIQEFPKYRDEMLNLKEIPLQYVTNQAGEKTAVLFPIGEFRALMEDIDDLAAIAERREESTVSHEELLGELKRDGLI